MIRIDLHTHSIFSDGSLTPEELVQRAVRQQVQMLALTDHDSVDGIAVALQAASNQPLLLVAGVELSVLWEGKVIHVIALHFPHEAPELTSLLQRQHELRAQRGRAIADALASLGFNDTYDEALARACGPEHVGRLHFAQVLVERAVVADVQQAFDRYLRDGRKAAIPANWVDLQSAVEVLRRIGASTVLAHPMRYTLSATQNRKLFGAFKDAGGEAVEVASLQEAAGPSGWLSDTMRKMGFKASQGSDFHGSSTPWLELGRCRSVPDHLEPVWQAWPQWQEWCLKHGSVFLHSSG